MQAPVVLRVLNVVLERRLRRGKLLHDFLETRLICFGQINTGQVELAQRMLDNALARRIAVAMELLFHGCVSLLQANIL